MISYREMTPGDISAGLSLCRTSGWNQLAHDWELFLQSNPKGCFVAIDDHNHVSGTVTTLRYDDRFSWIGMVLVDPQVRRQGIGSGLLQQALEVLSNEKTIKLDATPEGREVYLKLGFHDEYAITRMHLDKIIVDRLPVSTAVPLGKEDIDEVLKFDRDVFGADRSFILKWLLDGAPELSFVAREKGRISGYCFGRYGHNFTQVGPVIATDVNQAIDLATAALQKAGNGPVIIDMLHHTPAWTRAVENLGFVERRKLIRMYKGSNAWPGLPNKQFSIAGPEFG
ncbi:MAG: GNAT family N-acetyltransferase [Bacteroidota bacterium]